MKTSELYLEQVLIGALAIVIVVLPWLRELATKLSALDTASGLAGGSLALGLAFWLGIPLDRLADTLSERLDRHGRLRFALARAKGWPLPVADERGRLDRDVYPEDRLRIAGLRDKDAVVSWIDYHRSRIRLTRALALYGPAVTLMLTLGLERLRPIDPPVVNVAWHALVAVAYLLWTVLVRLGGALPRTDEAALIAYARRWRFVDAEGSRLQKTTTRDVAVWAAEWPSLVVPTALLAIALLVAASGEEAPTRIGACAGTVITLVSAWAWWRIGFTFRTYLYDLDQYPRDSRGGPPTENSRM
jgi:hypothetical protein